jgi:ferredoxin-NADP reductase
VAPVQKLRCSVGEIVNHGEHVYTVTLRPEHTAPRYRAGQFLHLALDDYDPSGFWPESRAFSIANAPTDRQALRITYSAQGSFTQRMERELRPGEDVWVKMPYGDFVIEPRGEVVLFAGGTGITAFTAFLDQLSVSDPCRVLLGYGARHAGLLTYRGQIERQFRRLPAATAVYFLEADTDTGIETLGGQVAVEPLWALMERPLEASYFIAGPPLMLKSITAELHSRRVQPGAIHLDAWE